MDSLPSLLSQKCIMINGKKCVWNRFVSQQAKPFMPARSSVKCSDTFIKTKKQEQQNRHVLLKIMKISFLFSHLS